MKLDHLKLVALTINDVVVIIEDMVATLLPPHNLFFVIMPSILLRSS
jgi:hypothetical protein